MLKRIVETSSRPNDIVLDCFAGSGTTLVAAEELGRQWIGIDIGEEAITTIKKRFAVGRMPMGDYVNKKAEKQMELNLFDETETEKENVDLAKETNNTTYDLFEES